MILESESGTYASTASAKKHARIAVEAPYVFTNSIVVFVNNAKEHPFAGMVCRNPDALFAKKKPVLRMSKSMVKLRVIGLVVRVHICFSLAQLQELGIAACATQQGWRKAVNCGVMVVNCSLKNLGTTSPSSLSLGCM